MRARLFLILVSGVLAAQNTPWTMLRLPDTGQTARYTQTSGEDGAYTINPPAFTRHGDGTVTDLVTGLQWQETDGGEMTWESAVTYCRGLSLAGRGDWRLPSTQESFSILNHAALNPALDTKVFVKTGAEYWWASEERAADSNFAWATNAGGGAGSHPKRETLSAGGNKRYHARCVRHSATGTGDPAPFTDRGDGSVLDNRTGLVWQKTEPAASMTWEEALVYSEGLTLGGKDDWRLPNIKELQSLPLPGTGLFWSSTTQFNQTPNAWTVDFTTGIVSYNAKSERRRVRAVRAGTGPRVAFGGIVNASNYLGGPISAGEILSIFGTQFGNAGRVLIQGRPAPVVAWQDTQVSVIVPKAVSGSTTARVDVGPDSPPMLAGVAPSAPGIFTVNASGSGQAAALNEDSSLNGPARPAARGGIVVLYATGHGATDPPLADGVPLDGTSPRLTLPVEVRIGGQPAAVLYAGLVFGLPAGLLQVNVRVPDAAPAGDNVPVVLRIGDKDSQPGATLSLR